jgi:hypothetical protein
MIRALLATFLLAGLAHAQATNHCVGAQNSVGSGATIAWVGPTTIAQGGLAVTGLPRAVTGLFVYGLQRDQAPFGDGFRCIGGANWILARERATTSGTVALDLASEGEPEDLAWLASASTWSFQYLYRDPRAQQSGGVGFNSTDAVEVVLGP